MNKMIKKAVREDVREYDENIVLQTLHETTSSKKANKSLQQNRKLLVSIENESGMKVHNREEIVTTVTDFYKSLYKKSENKEEIEAVRPPRNEEKTPNILEREVECCLKKLKENKCPGPDRIKNEWLKMLAVPLTKILTSIFNEILRKNEIPIQWEMSEIIILHKKGNKNKVENYRPITLILIYAKFS